jgi:hypothetical protein
MSANGTVPGGPPHAGRLPELEWNEISEPGCYLHLASGLLARLFPEDVRDGRHAAEATTHNRVVRLADDPGAPLAALRLLAERHGHLVRF